LGLFKKWNKIVIKRALIKFRKNPILTIFFKDTPGMLAYAMAFTDVATGVMNAPVEAMETAISKNRELIPMLLHICMTMGKRINTTVVLGVTAVLNLYKGGNPCCRWAIYVSAKHFIHDNLHSPS